jgi:hypothetical protein
VDSVAQEDEAAVNRRSPGGGTGRIALRRPSAIDLPVEDCAQGVMDRK